MKVIIKKAVSLVLCILFAFSSFCIGDYSLIDGFKLSANAAGENYYMINGKIVRYDSVNAESNEEYVLSLYKFIWGVEYTNDFNSTDNILKNESHDERALNADNLKRFVLRCQPGAVIKVENIRPDEVTSTYGRSLLIVSTDTNGLSVCEYTDARHELYYTWDQFCNTYIYSTIRFIKWPNSFYASETEINETDYKKPERALYYDSQSMLSGDDVRWVQQKLKDIGYSISVDGYYSKHTESIVRDFQSDYSLKVTGIVESTTADMLEHPMKKPGGMEIKISGEKDLSIGDVLTVEWKDVEHADSYHLFVYNSRGNLVDELDRINANKASFVLNSSGTYTVKGYAQNSVYVGELSTMSQKVKVHNTYTVKFVDDDGTLLNKQAVAYGQDAAVPASPKKTGYTFKGWDKEFTNVTSSLTVNAVYIKKAYTVRFENDKGELIGTPQKVLYGEPAEAPDTKDIEGFVGWNKDFSSVTSSMTVTAVVNLSDNTLPFSVSNATASREAESSGYSVIFKVTNNSIAKRIGRAVVALKTTAGKFLTLTESSAFAISPSNERTMKVFVPYDKAATVVEIYIVSDYNNLIPLSKVAVVNEISTENNYTDWLTDEEAPKTYYSATDYRTEYRYREKEFDNNRGYSSRPGWERYKVDYTLSKLTDSGWSSYTTNPISDVWETTLNGNRVQTRHVQTKTETYDSSYHIESFCSQAPSSPYYRHYWSTYTVERQSYGCWARSADVSIDYWNSLPSVGSGAWSSGTYAGQNKAGVTGKYDGNAYIWFWKYANQSQRTLYRYQDITINYNYSFYRWKDWSDWSTTPIAKADNNEVETRKTRRYEVNDPTEVNTGVSRTITGALDSSLAGKQVTLFIYKIGEASDYTNEYVGQSTIGEDGTYKFSFKLLDEPSTLTGDYTVALGIEGTSSVIYLDKIIAPKPTYTVNICDDDGTILDTQIVSRGDSATLPQENPSKPGYTFAGWNYSNASIFEDTNITALYVQDEYTVTFIDWTNERFEMQSGYHYGDPIIVPDFNETDEYVPVCWDGVTENMTVTHNMVVTAKYDVKEFTVKFYDYDKNLLSEQTVNYGETAEAPILKSTKSTLFLAWDNCSFDCVVNDLEVYPVYCYAKTVSTPVATIDSGEFSDDITIGLSCETPNSRIYYALFNNEDEIIEQEYTGPITITESTRILFYAACEGYNDSLTTVNCYAINKTGDQNDWAYPVNIYYNGSLIAEDLLKAGTVISSDLANDLIDKGYDFVGFYTDKDLKNPLGDNVTVSGEMNLYVKTQPKKYSVKFCFDDGTVISEQLVDYLGLAELPANVKVDEGKVFIGWDSDKYLCVTDNITIKAIVKESTSLANISLNKTSMTMISGMSFALVPTVTPESFKENTIVWTSSDSSIVKVDANGNVTALSPGNAVVTATLAGDVERKAFCEITVNRNSEEDITLIDGSELRIDDGKLLGIKPEKNSVDDVISEITSGKIVAYSSEGKVLNNNDKMETGSMICLVDNNGNILDALTVVVMGDANGDGLVNNKDAALIHRYVVGKEPNAFTDSIFRLAADVDNDGVISNIDCGIILNYLEEKSTVLSA